MAAILLAVALVACETSATSNGAAAELATLAPTDTPIPTPTKVPLDPFATAEIPMPDPELLANLKGLLSLVPQGYMGQPFTLI